MSIIKIENLSKKYNLYEKPVDRVKEAFHPTRKKYHKEFYALRNITFDVNKGDVIGIIGKNGAGKSTLLKILTGVLSQSEGNYNVNGRISALLELGGGINPEYTGKENIYFNGSILGLSKEEVDLKMQEIVDFADIGDFINIPVKTYSSGMIVRLAFAIAINIDPDILIVDEALSVGDVRFQQKSLRKMRELMEKAQAILFVTHDMGTVLNFCNKVVWLRDGEVFKVGEPNDICKQYLSYMAFDDVGVEGEQIEKEEEGVEQENKENTDVIWLDTRTFESYGEGGAKIEKIAFHEKNDCGHIDNFNGNEQCVLRFDIKSFQNNPHPIYGFILKDSYGNQITGMNTFVYEQPIEPLTENDRFEVVVEFKLPNLKNGTYTISPALAEGSMENHIQHHWIHDAIVFNVNSKNITNSIGWYFILDEVTVNTTKCD